jgi:UDP-3-O-[3-hydroxymyristoyl] glucosamine N-acyltransferase
MAADSTACSLARIAEMVGAAAPSGAEAISITGVATLAEAGPSELSFLGSETFFGQFRSTAAAAVLVQKKIRLPAGKSTQKRPPLILMVDDADLAMSLILRHFEIPSERPPVGIDRQARVDSSAQIASDAVIGPFCFVGKNTRIGPQTIVHAGAYIGEDVTIGRQCEIFPNVVIRQRITIGDRVVIHGGSVLGSDGFGYRWDGSKHAKIPQIGTVIIEDDVEIGSCVCIDRAKFSATRIGRGTKIDNLVQIGHNVVIGPHCIIVGQAGLAGSATLGTGVVLGGQVAIRDHITLGDGVMVAACSAVAEDIPANAVVSGTPALPHRQVLREFAAIRRLPDLVVHVRKLQEEMDRLKAEIGQLRGAERKD